ncbi:MAG: tRNA (guanosine(46)-N7)-methyltransferase TrmB, partial [Clostridia bacterium]|nr:tRNA (guanosine(46)-N7)-methyltransferase TrmB [Clostridia bacterium]
HSIDTIYINFCDPWPKKGHAKRRLTSKGFLDIYRGILCEGGMLIFKTDNEGLFDFSMETFIEEGLEIVWHTKNLHAEENEIAKNNIMTEYERNFSQKGFNICSAHVRFRAKEETNA